MYIRMYVCIYLCHWFFNGSYGMDYDSMLLERLNCSTNQYLTVLQCSYSTIIGSECRSHSLDATVVCCELLPFYI